jgi:hypothetical protein
MAPGSLSWAACAVSCTSGGHAAGNFADVAPGQENLLALRGTQPPVLTNPGLVVRGSSSCHIVRWHNERRAKDEVGETGGDG